MLNTGLDIKLKRSFFCMAIVMAVFSKMMAQSHPDIRIDVHTERDENGNVTRFDSSYTLSFSTDGEPVNDSLVSEIFKHNGIGTLQQVERSFRADHWQQHPFFTDPNQLFKRMDSAMAPHSLRLEYLHELHQLEPLFKGDFFNNLDQLFIEHQNLLDELLNFQFEIRIDTNDPGIEPSPGDQNGEELIKL